MHSVYQFHFLNTVSSQLCVLLDQLPVTRLDATTLANLSAFQIAEHSPQGVYLIHLAKVPFYLGKGQPFEGWIQSSSLGQEHEHGSERRRPDRHLWQ